MFTGYQVISLGIAFVGMLVAVWGIIAKSQASLKADLQKALEEMKAAHAKSLEESRQQFSSINESFGKIALQINTILEGDVRELQARVQRLESGQDEWTKTIRQRTHDHANELQALRLEIELIKVGHPRPHGEPRKDAPSV